MLIAIFLGVFGIWVAFLTAIRFLLEHASKNGEACRKREENLAEAGCCVPKALIKSSCC